MSILSRRAMLTLICGVGANWALCGCATTRQSAGVDPAYRRTAVSCPTRQSPGTIVVDTSEHFLYLVEQGGRALRYGVGVGGEGFGWSGMATVHSKQQWPDWRPTNEYLQRRPEVRPNLNELDNGVGMVGGPANP